MWEAPLLQHLAIEASYAVQTRSSSTQTSLSYPCFLLHHSDTHYYTFQRHRNLQKICMRNGVGLETFSSTFRLYHGVTPRIIECSVGPSSWITHKRLGASLSSFLHVMTTRSTLASTSD